MIKLSKLAQDLQVTSNTLYRWIKEGTITVIKGPTGRNYVTEEEYARIINGKQDQKTVK